jgi:steroid 5-alpha reductase family enzyme
VGPTDMVLAGLALLGIVIAHFADGQLDGFMRRNQERATRGESPTRLLDHGIWRWSRHPNYFGEQLFWWAFAGFGVVVGEPWVVVGTALNTAVLAVVTVMTERRMLEVPERRDAYREYQRRTSVWLPWPPRRNPPDRGGLAR